MVTGGCATASFGRTYLHSTEMLIVGQNEWVVISSLELPAGLSGHLMVTVRNSIILTGRYNPFCLYTSSIKFKI